MLASFARLATHSMNLFDAKFYQFGLTWEQWDHVVEKEAQLFP